MSGHGYLRNYGCRLTPFELLGYRALALENELLRVVVLIDKGASIYELLHKPSDTDFLWRWERGLRPRGHVDSMPHPRGSFQDHFAGGWDEMFPTFGPAVPLGGLPVGYHGEVAVVPWEHAVERDDPTEVAASLSVRTVRAPFRLTRTLRLRRGVATLFVAETATNEAALEVSFAWGHHPDLGPPFLSADCVLDCGARRVLAYGGDAYERGRLAAEDQEGDWPHLRGRDGGRVDLSRVLPPDARRSDVFYLTDFGDPAWWAVTNRATGVGIGLAWSRRVMPSALVWAGFGGDEAAPWWGRAYTLALEPLSSHPMDVAEAERRGTLLRLGPGASLSHELAATAYTGRRRVRAVGLDGRVERGSGA